MEQQPTNQLNIEISEDEGVIYDGKVYGNSEEEIIKLNKITLNKLYTSIVAYT